MKNYVSFFEIPTIDFSRAKKFYQAILDISIDEMDMGGVLMGLFPNDGENVSGAIVQGEGYSPSKDGVTVYLNGGEDLQIILDKIIPNNGTVVLSKTEIGPEMGHYAVFLDTEGNKLALFSNN